MESLACQEETEANLHLCCESLSEGRRPSLPYQIERIDKLLDDGNNRKFRLHLG